MEDKLCFVQFLHPGGEHEQEHDDCKHWNIDPKHRRKFLTVPGCYRSDSGGRDHAADIALWGEWEPQSRVIHRFSNHDDGLPTLLHLPYQAQAPRHNAQNTDPFVFGESFLYTECQQHTDEGETQLRNLRRGSGILFGSCLGASFVLDTVLVVDEYVDHGFATYGRQLGRRLPKTYETATIDVLYRRENPDLNEHRLYFGATPERTVGGMFSFFPCLPWARASAGFRRPRILIPGLITQTKTQGYKLTSVPEIGGMKRFWDRIVGQVTVAGLALGTFAELPRAESACLLEMRSSASSRPSRASCPAPRNKPRVGC